MKILSSAKINLNLMINSETIDGLHTLSTLMVPINLFDEIEIHEIENTEDVIEFATEIEIDGESTIHKAMKALRLRLLTQILIQLAHNKSQLMEPLMMIFNIL